MQRSNSLPGHHRGSGNGRWRRQSAGGRRLSQARQTFVHSLDKKEWVPGPGSYNIAEDAKLRQPCSPHFSFGKEVKETALKQKDVQLQRNSGSYPKLEPHYTPGPGSYALYTSFGKVRGVHKENDERGSERYKSRMSDE